MMVPMMLTISRFFLTPCIMRAITMQEWGLATSFFLVAAVTDFLDGHLARLWQQQSKLGSYLDPLTDKFLMMGCYYSLYVIGILPAWFCIGIGCKELLLLSAAVLFGYKKEVAMVPLWSGKSAMFAQVIFVMSIFVLKMLNSVFVIPSWAIVLIFMWTIMPLVHYAQNISWRFV